MEETSIRPYYHHIDECTYSNEMKNFRQSNELFIGCACPDDCSNDEEDCVCFAQHGSAYTASGLLEDISSTEPVYECNMCCNCPSNCSNRLVQKAPPWRFKRYPTGDKGFALKTLDYIPKGSFVIEYIGEVISSDEASERLKMTDSCYTLSVKEYYGKEKHMYHIDATNFGNDARFINHSCSPNLFVVPVRVSSTLPLLCLFSIRDIEVDEELSFDYGHSHSDHPLSSSLASNRRICLCKADACKGFLPFHSDLFL